MKSFARHDGETTASRRNFSLLRGFHELVAAGNESGMRDLYMLQIETDHLTFIYVCNYIYYKCNYTYLNAIIIILIINAILFIINAIILF